MHVIQMQLVHMLTSLSHLSNGLFAVQQIQAANYLDELARQARQAKQARRARQGGEPSRLQQRRRNL